MSPFNFCRGHRQALLCDPPDQWLLCPPGNVYKFQTGSRFHAILWHKHLDDACKSNRPQVSHQNPACHLEYPLTRGPKVHRKQGYLLLSEPIHGALRRPPWICLFPETGHPRLSLQRSPFQTRTSSLVPGICPLKEVHRNVRQGQVGGRCYVAPRLRPQHVFRSSPQRGFMGTLHTDRLASRPPQTLGVIMTAASVLRAGRAALTGALACWAWPAARPPHHTRCPGPAALGMLHVQGRPGLPACLRGRSSPCLHVTPGTPRLERGRHWPWPPPGLPT